MDVVSDWLKIDVVMVVMEVQEVEEDVPVHQVQEVVREAVVVQEVVHAVHLVVARRHAPSREMDQNPLSSHARNQDQSNLHLNTLNYDPFINKYYFFL